MKAVGNYRETMGYDILAVNPGSTSTKIAVFRDREELFREEIEHDAIFLDSHQEIKEQFPLRRDMVLTCLKKNLYKVERLSAVVGRGGLLPPVKAGGYTVNQAMKDRILEGPISPHASNMGALIADAVAAPLGIPAYIYDAVSSDEFMEISRITGIPEVVRQSFCHVLNSKAMARRAAEEAGKSYG
ncbi:butyrate kinase, partial [Blautia pseudococcoides]|nr:butyrate kinase [Blautia pseudococcoides]